MKRLKYILMAIVCAGFSACLFQPAWGQQSITLPKGTTAEKIGAGHFKLKLPDGRIIEVKGLQKADGGTSIIGDCGIYDRAGKLIASSKGASLKSGPKPSGRKVESLKIDSKEYAKIDDEVTWLPATINLQSVAIGDPDPPPRSRQAVKPLSPQPDPPGKK